MPALPLENNHNIQFNKYYWSHSYNTMIIHFSCSSLAIQ